MKNTLVFTVAVSFEDKVTDENEVAEVAENIARAIKNESVRGMGIAPKNCGTLTVAVEVSNSLSGVNVRKSVV